MKEESVPKTLFYNWLYINALNDSPELAEQVIAYDAFSDIVFNPEKSVNCQAEAAAFFVSLKKLELLNEALKDINSFLNIAYKQQGVAGLGYKANVLPFGVQKNKAQSLENNKGESLRDG